MSESPNKDVVLRMRVSEDYIERDPDGSPRRKTIALELAGGSDENDDNEAVKASSVELKLHGCHEPGWAPFAKGGDFLVTITPAEALAKPEPTKPDPKHKKHEEK
jgi:hypothetical protein